MRSTLLIGLAVVLVLILALIAWGVSANNGLVALQENVHSAWGQVETVLQRRYDLIPNLVNTVKGYAKHERDVLEDVTRLRSQWASAGTTAEKVKASGELEAGLARLLLVAERYPDLKANANFRDLQYELSGTENRITVERQRYNDAVRAYNTRVRQFPTNIIAGMRGFAANSAYFEADREAKKAPKVDFGDEKH
ncbi:MAG: LemA family protein [Thermoguttaceae bacterium]